MSDIDFNNDIENNQEKVPESPTEIAKEIYIRILHGLSVVGRAFRGGYTSTISCIEQTVYPIKESCFSGYDAVNQYLNPSNIRNPSINTASVNFTHNIS